MRVRVGQANHTRMRAGGPALQLYRKGGPLSRVSGSSRRNYTLQKARTNQYNDSARPPTASGRSTHLRIQHPTSTLAHTRNPLPTLMGPYTSTSPPSHHGRTHICRAATMSLVALDKTLPPLG